MNFDNMKYSKYLVTVFYLEIPNTIPTRTNVMAADEPAINAIIVESVVTNCSKSPATPL